MVEIKVRPVAESTKALADVKTGDIYAYTYGSETAFEFQAVKQYKIVDGIYSYWLPEGTERIVFSNIAESAELEVSKNEDGSLKFRRTGTDPFISSDLIAGAAEFSAAEDGLTVGMKRMNSYLTVDLQMKSLDGTLLDLSEFIDGADLVLPYQAEGVVFEADGSITPSNTTIYGEVPGVPGVPAEPDDPTPSDELANGLYFIKAEDNIAVPFSSDESEANGYMSVVANTEENRIESNAFTFTSTENGYTIMDSKGRYLYATSGNYRVFASATQPQEGSLWNIEKQEDNTHKIENILTNALLHYSSKYSEFECSTTSGLLMPELIPYEKPETEVQGRKGILTKAGDIASGQTSYSLCTDAATLPTVTGTNSVLELTILNKSGNTTVIRKSLDFPFEENRHYKFTLVMKRNETGFTFTVEDMIEETIDIDLN
ncbi:MAG: hypothetical protein ACI4TM_07195 [Candidatus Cryptobacteroides sp.]